MLRKWTLKPADEQLISALVGETGFSYGIARLLVLRGLSDAAEIEPFLSPRLSGLSDPYQLPDMQKAAERIWLAVHRGETITVFGDYDVDGVTSAALLTRLLRTIGAHVHAFIPDRLDEGYGLSREALERCLDEHGSKLVVTVDCGTNAVESVATAQEAGVDVIVTDHHEPNAATAAAFALVNPKLGDCEELKTLAGVGVAFKLAHGLIKYGREQGFAGVELVELRHYLDFAALGTVADIVPLKGENRIIVRHGLSQLDASRWEGMRALKNAAGVRGEANTYHLGFQMGPRINAAGRIGQPMEALRLLVTDDPAEAREIAITLSQTNTERQALERSMAEEAFAEIDAYFDPSTCFGLVVAREGWHPGVVGIVASRIARHYNRPAIVMGIDSGDGTVRGSCRSIGAFDLLEGLRNCDHLLEKYGGHKMAAGLTVKVNRVEEFKETFNRAAKQLLEGVDLTPSLTYDAEIPLEELGWPLWEQMCQLSPFGEDNPEPVWVVRGVSLAESPRVVGGQHLKFSVRNGGQLLDAIAFNFPLDALPTGRVDMAFSLKMNEWNGQVRLQLQVKALRAAEV